MNAIFSIFRKPFVRKYANYLIVGAVLLLCGLLSLSGVIGLSDQLLLEQIAIAVLLAVSLCMVVGFLGELSLGHAGFMCIGADVGGKVSAILVEAMGVDQNNMLVFALALLVGGLQHAGGYIVEDGVAEDILCSLFCGNVSGGLADDNGQFCLVVQTLHQTGMALDLAAGSHGFADALGEVNGDGAFLDKGGIIAGCLVGVCLVVDAKADHILTGAGDGREQLYIGQRDGIAAGGGNAAALNEGQHAVCGQGKDGTVGQDADILFAGGTVSDELQNDLPFVRRQGRTK